MSFFGNIKDRMNFAKNADYQLQKSWWKTIYHGDTYYDDGILREYVRSEDQDSMYEDGKTNVNENYSGCDDNTIFWYEALANYASYNHHKTNYTFYKIYKSGCHNGDLCRTIPDQYGKQTSYLQTIGKFEEERVKILPKFQEEINLLPSEIKNALGIPDITHPRNMHVRGTLPERTPLGR